MKKTTILFAVLSVIFILAGAGLQVFCHIQKDDKKSAEENSVKEVYDILCAKDQKELEQIAKDTNLKIEYVNEIIVLQEITVIPETEDYIKGLINLRGKIIPVIDVRLRFRQEPFEYNDRTCIIVINVNSTVVGLIVEKIAEVVEISEENLMPSPTIAKQVKSQQDRYVYAIGKVGDSVKLLLDPDKLLHDDMVILEQVSGESEADDTEE